MVNRNSTLKNKGGDLQHSTFKGILSIGYEFETGGLSKLTYISTYEDEGISVLFNSDTARKDIELFESQDFELDEEDSEYDNLVLRQEETVSLPLYKTNSEQIDSHSKFYITNDFSQKPFHEYLLTYCGEDQNLSNQMYKIVTEDEKEYFLHFVNKSEKNDVECSAFSFVEWIVTYYQPVLSENIIINTFVNAIQNLIRHLDQLEMQNVKFKYYSNEEGIDMLITQPLYRKLFHLPDTNLYYFQSEYLTKEDEKSRKVFSVNDITFVPQMTFSCHVNDILRIMRSMIYHNIDSSEIYHKLYKILITVQNHVTELISSFDESLLTNKKIFTYLTLIFYKLHQYYNHYLNIEKSKRQYFKNSVFFNVRHSNYLLYLELKKEMIIHYAGSSEHDVIELIRDLMCQETILKKFLNVKKKNVFKREPFIEKPTEYVIENVIDPKTCMPITRYGNLEFSFVSYLQFFEDPLENGDNDNHDWLVYADIDSYSQTMEIHNDILLVEARYFFQMLYSYMEKIPDEQFQTHFKRENFAREYSIDLLKHFLEIYNFEGLQQKSKKSKTRRSKK